MFYYKYLKYIKKIYAPAMTMAGALSVTSVCTWLRLSNDLRILSRIL